MAQTRILLLEDVDNVGRKGDIATVKPGYAFNFLIPQKLALIADAQAMRRQARLQEERRKKAEVDRKEAEETAARLNGETVAKEVKVDHDGHMYGSVSSHDIMELIKLQTGIELEKKALQLKHAIKQTGVYDIVVRLKEDITATIHVKVMPENAEEAPKA
jgi:large subunit ribosomal protein L9